MKTRPRMRLMCVTVLIVLQILPWIRPTYYTNLGYKPAPCQEIAGNLQYAYPIIRRFNTPLLSAIVHYIPDKIKLYTHS